MGNLSDFLNTNVNKRSGIMNIAFNQVSRVPDIKQPLFPSEKMCDGDLFKVFNEKLCDGKLLAKMLINSISKENCLARAEQECTQLSQGKTIQCAATSLLVPNSHQRFYRRIGLLIDVDKSIQKVIANQDVGSVPVDDQGYELQWNKGKKCFESNGLCRGVVVNPEAGYALDYSIRRSHLIHKFQTTKELKDYMVEQSKCVAKGMLLYNEVVCEYSVESVIGIIAAYNHPFKPHDNKQQILHDGKEFKKMTEQEFGFSLPLLSFDCETGTFSHLET